MSTNRLIVAGDLAVVERVGGFGALRAATG